VELIVGPEVVTGSTRMKAGTATKLALNMLTTAAMLRLGKVWGNLMIDLRVSNDKLSDRALRIITQQTALGRDAARDLLHAAEGSVKRALVMAKLNCAAAAADAKLRESGGKLRPLLGPPRGPSTSVERRTPR
jgi:N-acetylmuramic acid 6-phosphate etherase